MTRSVLITIFFFSFSERSPVLVLVFTSGESCKKEVEASLYRESKKEGKEREESRPRLLRLSFGGHKLVQ